MNNVLLEELATIRTGYQFRSEAPFSADGEFSIIQLRDSKEALNLDDHEVQRFDLSDVKQIELLFSGDILLRAKGNNHYAVLIDRDLKNTLAGALCLIIRCTDKNLSPNYLTWYLNQPPAQSFLNKISAGTSIPIVNKKSLGALVVPLPPLAKQKAIGNLYQLQLKEGQLSREILEAKRRLLNSQMLEAVKTDPSTGSGRASFRQCRGDNEQ